MSHLPTPDDLLRALLTGDVAATRQLVERRPALLRTPVSPPLGRLPLSPRWPLDLTCQGPFHGLPLGGRAADLARVLLTAGADPQGAEPERTTPLHDAVSLGATDVAAALLHHGAELEAVSPVIPLPHGTPLDYAVQFGTRDCVDLLLAYGAQAPTLRLRAGAGLPLQPGNPTLPELHEALHAAVVCDRLHTFEQLRALTPDLHSAWVGGASLLHWAAWEAKPRMVQHLLQLGLDPHATDHHHGGTPAAWAAVRQEQLGPGGPHGAVIAVLGRWQ